MPRLLALLPMLALACDATVAGNNDVLRFRYDADDNFLPVAFSTPIGVGLAVRVEVFVDPDDGGGAPEMPAQVIDAASSDAAVVTVLATASNVITLVAHGPGNAEVRVESSQGNDVFDVSVVAVATVDLSHPGVIVADNPPSKCIVGGTASFIVALKSASNTPAVGVGALDVTIEPAGAAVALDSERIGFLPVNFKATGAASITGRGDAPLPLEVIANADVAALSLAVPAELGEVSIGTAIGAVLRGLTAADDKVVGVASLATVNTEDPRICSVVPNPALGEGAYLIMPNGPGRCRVTAALGERTVSHELTVKPL